MTIDWDNCPSNTSFLERETDPEKTELTEAESAEDQLRRALEQAYTKDKLSKQVQFNAVCLRKLKESSENTGVVRVKARIPELHSLLPKPSHDNDYATMSIYPTFIALQNSFKDGVGPSSQAIPPGSILLTTFGNMSNFSQPRILEIGNIAGSNARSTSSSGAGSSAGSSRGSAATPGSYPPGSVDAPLINLKDYFATNERINFGNSRHWGTEAMKKFLEEVSALTMAGFEEEIWYVQDVAKSERPTGLLPPHGSHQSGIDVDISIPIGNFTPNAAFGKGGAKELAQTIKLTSAPSSDERKTWNWMFLDRRNPGSAETDFLNDPTSYSDAAFNLITEFLQVAADNKVRMVLWSSIIINKYLDMGISDTDIVKPENKGKKFNAKIMALGAHTDAEINKRRDLAKKAKLKDSPGHQNHFHVRVNGVGYKDADGNGKTD